MTEPVPAKDNKALRRSAAQKSKASLEERLADEARFIKSWLDNPKITGAVSPSGRFLARTMARAIDPRSTGPVIELGPGTGPVTQALLEQGIAPERLVLVEYDAGFCKLLAKRFPGVRIIQGDAYDLPATLKGQIDAAPAAIVSSLPLLSRPESARLSLLADGLNMMRPDGVFVQFTYGMVSPVPRRLGGTQIDWFDAEGLAPVWLNLPPARVWLYRRPGQRHAVGAPARKPGLIDKVGLELRETSRKVESEIRQTTRRLETEWRETTGKVRDEMLFRTLQMRRDLIARREALRNEKLMRPALAFIDRMAEKKRRR